MKLIKQTDQKKGDTKCCAITNSGDRCSFNSKIDGLCMKHHKIQQSVVKHLSEYHGGIIEEVPKAPPTLEGKYANRWRKCCENLISHKHLYGIFLEDIMRLIVNEMILDDLEDALQKNKNNFLNHYVTEGGQTGNQVNGEWSILSQTRKEIASLKKSLNFTMDGQMNLVKAGGGSSPDSKNNNLRSKAKGWYK